MYIYTYIYIHMCVYVYRYSIIDSRMFPLAHPAVLQLPLGRGHNRNENPKSAAGVSSVQTPPFGAPKHDPETLNPIMVASGLGCLVFFFFWTALFRLSRFWKAASRGPCAAFV